MGFFLSPSQKNLYWDTFCMRYSFPTLVSPLHCCFLLFGSGGGRRHSDLFPQVRGKGRWNGPTQGRKGRLPTAGMRVRNGKSQSRFARRVDRKTAGDPPGIALPGGVPSTYSPGPGPLDMWDSWRGEPQCGRRRGSRGMWGHRPDNSRLNGFTTTGVRPPRPQKLLPTLHPETG